MAEKKEKDSKEERQGVVHPPKRFKVTEGPKPPEGWIIVDEEGFMKITIPGPITGETLLRMFEHVRNVDQYVMLLTESNKGLERNIGDLTKKIEDLTKQVNELIERKTIKP